MAGSRSSGRITFSATDGVCLSSSRPGVTNSQAGGPTTSACTERFDWGKGGSTRYCDRCAKNVHNLSQMTWREAERFLDAHAGQKVCVQYSVDGGGSLTFKPRPRPAFVAIASLALAACTGVGDAYELESPGDAPLCHDAQGPGRPMRRGRGLAHPDRGGRRVHQRRAVPGSAASAAAGRTESPW